MNRSNLREKLAGVGRKVATGTVMTAAGIGSALASTGPDTSAITAEFDVYKAAVVALVIGFAVVLWSIRGAGLLKPR